MAGPLTNAAVAASNGLFTVALDFGTGVFTGDARWLEIAARTNGGAGLTKVDLQSLNTHNAITAELGWQLVDSPRVGLYPQALITASLFGTTTQLVTADYGSNPLEHPVGGHLHERPPQRDHGQLHGPL